MNYSKRYKKEERTVNAITGAIAGAGCLIWMLYVVIYFTIMGLVAYFLYRFVTEGVFW